MRKLLYVVLALAVLWSGYWLAGQWAVRRGIEAWAAEQRAAGMQLDWSDLRVWGYPNRFDVTLTEPRIDDGQGGGWRAPFVQALALAYNPQSYVVVWPHEQVLTLAGRDWPIASQNMRASVLFFTGPSFRLKRSRLVVDELDVAGRFAAQAVRFSTEAIADSRTGHRVGLELRQARLPAELRAALDPQGQLPETVERLHLDATLDLDRPLDRHALSGRLGVTSLNLSDLTLAWGDVSVTVTGTVEADAEGLAEGEVTVTAQNWRRLLDLAVAAGVVPEDNRKLVETGLAVLAQGDRLEAPLRLEDGRVALGPLPLGDAPRLRAP